MSDRMALKIAIDLVNVPSQVRLLRSEPLPDGVLALLRIAAGDGDAENVAAALIDRPPETVRHAAAFFIEQILFAPEADSYRVLGAAPQASAGELRRNVALLLRWLHPDREPDGERAVFVGRATAAWNDLKTPERRAAYDDVLRRSGFRGTVRHSKGKSRSSRQRMGKFHSGGWRRGLDRSTEPARAADRIGFFRRALSVLFNRPLQ